MAFKTQSGVTVPAVTADQMRAVDQVAVEVFGLGILQMMENAGRSLAQNVNDLLNGRSGPVVVLAGSGGNGGGGLCCARHLHNRGIPVQIVLDRDATKLVGPVVHQYHTLQAAGIKAIPSEKTEDTIRQAEVVVDALIGYGLRGAARGWAAQLIRICNQYAARTLSLDVPSGLNATTGAAAGPVIRPTRILTLALPKTGLREVPGALYLADIGIPPAVYEHLGVSVPMLFESGYWIPLTVNQSIGPYGISIDEVLSIFVQ